MGNRQNLIDALNHRQPEKLPVDFGGTAVTGIHVLAMARLRQHYGLPGPVKVAEPYQMLGLMEQDLMDAMGITVAGVLSSGNLFGFDNRPPYKPWRTPWGQDVLVPEEFRTTGGPAGDEYIYPCGDISAPPSGHMPAGGYFFDSIIRQEPFEEDTLDYRDNLEEFGPVGEAELAYLKREADRLRGLDAGAIGGLPGTALGDIAWVPGAFELPDVVVDSLPGQAEFSRQLGRRGRFPGHREQTGAQRMQDRIRPAGTGDGFEGPGGSAFHGHDYLYGQIYLSIGICARSGRSRVIPGVYHGYYNRPVTRFPVSSHAEAA